VWKLKQSWCHKFHTWASMEPLTAYIKPGRLLPIQNYTVFLLHKKSLTHLSNSPFSVTTPAPISDTAAWSLRPTCWLVMVGVLMSAQRHATAALRTAAAVRPACQTQFGRIMSRTIITANSLNLAHTHNDHAGRPNCTWRDLHKQRGNSSALWCFEPTRTQQTLNPIKPAYDWRQLAGWLRLTASTFN